MKTRFENEKELLINSRVLLREVKNEVKSDKVVMDYMYGKTDMFATEPKRAELLHSEISRLENIIYMSKSRMSRITRRGK